MLALTEVISAQALAAIETESSGVPGVGVRTLTQQHELIRDADDYADLFAQAAAVPATSTLAAITANTTANNNAP